MRAGAGALGARSRRNASSYYVRRDDGRNNQPLRSFPMQKRKRGNVPWTSMLRLPFWFRIYLGGTVASLVRVFMWQGPWAALAAVGLLAVLFAMSQTIVMATNVGAR